MGQDAVDSGLQYEFVGGASFSNDISATIPLIRLVINTEKLEFRFRGPLGWIHHPRILTRDQVKEV